MNYLILAEIILGYYYLKNSFNSIHGNKYLLLLVFVVYLITKIIYYIDFNKIVSKVIIAVSLFVLLLDYYVGFGVMLIFFPITLCQLNNSLLGNKKVLYLLLALPLLIISTQLIDIYVITAGFSFILELSTRRSNEKISKLNEKIFTYKQHQEKLNNKLKASEQHKEHSIYQVKLEERNSLLF